MVGKKAVLMFVLLSLGLVAATFHPAQSEMRATINFSGLAEGAIVGSLSHGAGISGDPIEGSVSVFGSNPAFPSTNTAMIFDATCAGGCSGGDDDLHFPELGSVLIISEDLDSTDPDDADNPGAFFRFDFSNFGKGKVNVESLIVGDVDEATGEIKLYRDGVLEKTVPFSPTGDHMYAEVRVGVENIDLMVVDLNGSGIIDNVKIVIVEEPLPTRISLQGTCEPIGQESNDLRLTGALKRDGNPIPNHAISLNLPGGNKVSLNTDQAGKFSYLFIGARNYMGQNITAVATVDGSNHSTQHEITPSDFEGCNPSGVQLSLQGTCEPKGQPSGDLRLTGELTRGGNPIPNHAIKLNLPDGNEVSLSTDQAGIFSYLFEGAIDYKNQLVTVVATEDGGDFSAQHEITLSDFDGCGGVTEIASVTLQGTCALKGQVSHDLRLTGALTGGGGVPVPNHAIKLTLPDGNNVSLNTDQAGRFSYLFEGADQYHNQIVKAEATVNGVDYSATHRIAPSDFEACQRTYKCHNVFLYTSFGQPIELGSQVPGWGLEDVHVVCKGIGQGKSCRIKVKGQPGYVVKSDTLEMDVPRLLPHVKYQAQIKGYDGAWTNKGCEFSFITGGQVASTSTHLSVQGDQLGWVSLGEGQSALKPLGVCSGWSDACLFAENIIGFHLDDIYGNQLPGSELSVLQPGDRISIYRDHRLYTYEFTGSERVRQSAEGNQAVLDAAEQHDLVLTTCSGYRLIDEGRFSHTRLATFSLLPRIERLYQGK